MLPFSWPFLAAFPIMLGIVAGAQPRRARSRPGGGGCPPAARCCWLLGSFAAATAAAAVITHLPAGAALAVAAVTGLVNARAWYGLAAWRPRRSRAPTSRCPPGCCSACPSRRSRRVMVVALVVGVARLHVHRDDPASDQPGAGRRGRRWR